MSVYTKSAPLEQKLKKLPNNFTLLNNYLLIIYSAMI